MTVRQIFHRLLENPLVFGASQRLLPFTHRDCRALVEAHIALPKGGAVLDIGCGVGSHRPLFPDATYTGIDINPEYVAWATQAFGPGFQVMDAGRLEFPDASFDAAVSIAMCHHLNDGIVRAMATEAFRVLRPGGALHIIDPVLPESDGWFKRMVFTNDRGGHQRSREAMTSLVESCGRIAGSDLRSGVMHDVLYLRVQPG
ncbi:MAG TPA: class I SAM-dependent methyltransferase [Acetobacteraceae bacterium]